MDTILSEINYQPYLETLDKLGFCTFPVFDNNDIAQLFALYQSNFGNQEMKNLYATHNSNPLEQSLRINAEIKKIVNDKLLSIFPGYEYFVGHFMVKAAHVNQEFSLHQDWNIVDESKYKSYQIWIPLQLTYPANGGMFVIPGSHKFMDNFRSGSYKIPLIPFDDKFKPVIANLNVAAGDALVYHNALFHASTGNITDENRVVVIVNYVEKNAPTYYYHKNKEKGVTELYSIDAETLIKNLPALEKGNINEGFPYAGELPLCTIENDKITPDDLVAHYHNKVSKHDAGQIKQLHITKTAELENELNERGYVIVDMLSPEEVKMLRAEYDKHFGGIDKGPGRFTTLQSTNNEIKNEIHRFIVNTVERSVSKYFKDYCIPVSQFYTKKGSTSGDIELHADSTLLLNHQLEPHYAIWIPLLDVGANNGGLTIVPGSHKVKGAVFGGTFKGYHYEHRAWLNRFEVPLHLKAGQGVVFDNNLLHNSTANKTNTDRVCVTFRLTHTSSQYYSFYRESMDADVYDIFKEPHSFYMDEDWDGDEKKPEKKPAGTFKNSLINPQTDELEKILKAY